MNVTRQVTVKLIHSRSGIPPPYVCYLFVLYSFSIDRLRAWLVACLLHVLGKLYCYIEGKRTCVIRYCRAQHRLLISCQGAVAVLLLSVSAAVVVVGQSQAVVH